GREMQFEFIDKCHKGYCEPSNAMAAIFSTLSLEYATHINKFRWQNEASGIPVAATSSSSDKPPHAAGRGFLSSNEPGDLRIVTISHLPTSGRCTMAYK